MRGLINLCIVALFMVTWHTLEKYYECNTRYAVGCLPPSTDCGIPNVVRDNIKTFDTLDDVLKFLNTPAAYVDSGTISVSNVGIYQAPKSLPKSATDVKVFVVMPVNMEQHVVGAETVQELRRVDVQKDKTEWRVAP